MSDSKALIVRRSGLVKSVGSKIAITEKLLGNWVTLLLGAECDRNAILIEESEVDRIQRKLAEIRESIPRMPDNTTYYYLRRRDQKRNIWYRNLTDADKLAFYKRPNQSYPEGCFNPNRFFEAFDKVRLKEGYFLDYHLYTGVGSMYGGAPDLFARKVGSLPLPLIQDVSTVKTETVADVLEFEKSASGLFQLALFYAVHDRFYLFAHRNYGDYQPVLTRRQYDALLQEKSDNVSPEALELLKRQDIRPRIVMNSSDSGHVTMFHFNRFRGFFWIRYAIEAGKVSDEKSEQVAWLLRKINF
jgi:hypothetical protein